MSKQFYGATIPDWLDVQAVVIMLEDVDCAIDNGETCYLCSAVERFVNEPSPEYDEWLEFLMALDLGTGFGVFSDGNLERSKVPHLAQVPTEGNNNPRRLAFLDELLGVLNA